MQSSRTGRLTPWMIVYHQWYFTQVKKSDWDNAHPDVNDDDAIVHPYGVNPLTCIFPPTLNDVSLHLSGCTAPIWWLLPGCLISEDQLQFRFLPTRKGNPMELTRSLGTSILICASRKLDELLRAWLIGCNKGSSKRVNIIIRISEMGRQPPSNLHPPISNQLHR